VLRIAVLPKYSKLSPEKINDLFNFFHEFCPVLFYRIHFCTIKITDIKKAPVFTGAFEFGGSGEIRTHGGLTPSSVFKTGALNRSATLPCAP
jgi:hypothetical protein